MNLLKAVIKGKRIDESEIFCAGDKSVMCEINGFKVGLSICYDLRFRAFQGIFSQVSGYYCYPKFIYFCFR